MFISCSWISLYTSTILISAKPATQKNRTSIRPFAIVLAALLSRVRNNQTFVLNYSDAVGVADTLIQRGTAARRGRKVENGAKGGELSTAIA